MDVLEVLTASAFHVGTSPVSVLELLAAVLALGMVACNLRVHPAGWPLAIVSSALYAGVFFRSQLYGEAVLQLMFIGLSAWGWWRWLRPLPASTLAHGITRLGPKQAVRCAVVTGVAWIALGLTLARTTDSDLPWADALATCASVLGQWLLARKFLENWIVWLGVNGFSVGLFALKGLWPTVALYAVLAVLSWTGWRHWSRQLQASARD